MKGLTFCEIAEWCKKIVNGEMQAHEIVMNIGMMQKGLMQEEIARGSFVPNSLATIKKKGSDKPLIDTGIVGSSVNYQIVEKGNSIS